jgi:phosphinothricin acetyltransferase
MPVEHTHEESEIGIRHATDADLAFVLSLLNPQIESSPFVYAEAPLTLDERLQWLAAHARQDLPVLIACDAFGTQLGWGSLSPYRSSSGYRFTLEASVYVDPRVHRRGVATRLLGALESCAIERGAHVILASIDAANQPSIALFERSGYSEVARLDEVGWKFGQWRTQLLLSKRLTV